jgi:hypothetical protein
MFDIYHRIRTVFAVSVFCLLINLSVSLTVYFLFLFSQNEKREKTEQSLQYELPQFVRTAQKSTYGRMIIRL